MITPKALQRLSSLMVLVLLLFTIIPTGPIHSSGSEDFIVSSYSSAEDVQDDSATLTVLNGAVYLRKMGEEAWSPVTETTWVRAGDTVKTEANGTAILTFLDGTDCLIDPSTEMTVTALQLNPEEPSEIRLKLWAGTAWNKIMGVWAPGSTYTVETPSAVLVARGTAWWVRVDLDGRTWVVILEGHVDIEGVYTLIGPDDLKPGDLGPNDGVREELSQEGLGLGVAAQIYFIAQQLETGLTEDELAELKEKLGVETSITDADLAAALESGTLKLSDIKKLTGNPGSSDGNLGMIVSESKSSDKSDNSSNDNSNKGGNDNSNKGGKKK